MVAPYRRLAVITKMLHLKRPALVPVLDSLVVQQLGGRGRIPSALVAHVRSIGQQNDAALRSVQDCLRTLTADDGMPIDRSLGRILDALLWTTHRPPSSTPG